MNVSPAHRKLRDAVEEFIREEWGVDPNVVLADWIMVTHHTGWNDDGDGISKYGIVYMNGDMAPHQSTGLLNLISGKIEFDYYSDSVQPGREDE